MHLTDELRAAHTGEIDETHHPYKFEDKGSYVEVLVLLTSLDEDFEDGYKRREGLVERLQSVSELYGGRRGYWWQSSEILYSMDSLYNSEPEED